MVTGLQHQPPDEQTLTAYRWLADDPAWPRRVPLHRTDPKEHDPELFCKTCACRDHRTRTGRVLVEYKATTRENGMRESENLQNSTRKAYAKK